MGYYGVGKGFRVNGVMVGCGICVHKNETLEDGVCHDCWMAAYHDGDVEDIAFVPADKERFLRLEKLVHKYREQISEIKGEAKECGIPFRELLSQFVDRDVLEVCMRIK